MIVADLRAILVKNENDEDEYLTLKSDAPLITRLGGIMHDTCNTANLAAVRIIEAKNEAGIATFGREAWDALPPEERETFDALCFNHTRQLPVAALRQGYRRVADADLLGPALPLDRDVFGCGCAGVDEGSGSRPTPRERQRRVPVCKGTSF